MPIGSVGDRELLQLLPVAVYCTDAEGRITFFNQAAATQWGREPKLGEFWCGSYRILKLDLTPLPLDECPMAIALHERRAVRGVEIIIERPDGTRAHVLPHPEPIFDRAGRLLGAINMLVDVTGRRESEAARGLLAAIVQSSDDAIISKTLDGRITSWNVGAERLFGYRAEEVIGKPVTILIPPERLPEEDEILGRLRRGERLEHFETVRLTKDGTRVDISLTVSPVRDGEGRIIGASKVARNISDQIRTRAALENQQQLLEEAVRVRTAELQESNQRLRLAERMASLGTLSAGLGHDLGNLLFPMRIRIETLEKAGLPEDLRGEVEAIKTSAEYLQRLANGLRLMALDPDRKRQNEPTDLQTWWNEAQPVLKNTLPRGIVLEGSVEQPFRALMSRPALTQAVFNLVQNAGEAMRPRGRGTVRLSVTCEAGHLRLRIADDGPGMSPEVRSRCMEPFFTTKTRGISTGLGLVLVSGLIREAAGTVNIETELGKGTTFVIDLPAAPPPDASASANRGNALVALQDPRMSSFVASELRSLNLVVMRPEEGEKRAVDVLVTDEGGAAPPDARRVIVFADARAAGADGTPHLIGKRPHPDIIRRALRQAVDALRTAPVSTP